MLVIDLDGTVLDERPRHYGCYATIMQELGQMPLAEKNYWELKRQGVDAPGVLARTGSQYLAAEFGRRWLARIEAEEMLALDVAHVGAAETLRAWVAQGASLVLATLRQSASAVDRQLHALGLDTLFPRRAIASPWVKAAGKADAVRNVLKSEEAAELAWIGDTEADLQAARMVSCPAWLVTCGIRSPEFLSPLRPDRIAESLSQLRPFEVCLPSVERLLVMDALPAQRDSGESHAPR